MSIKSAKWFNPENTKIHIQTSDGRGTVGTIPSLTRNGWIEEGDVFDIEPWRTVDEWQKVLIEEAKALKQSYEIAGILYTHSNGQAYNVKCREKDANALDVLDRKAEKENYAHSTWFLNSDTSGIELVTKEDYDELNRQMHDHWQKGFNAYGQTVQGAIMLLSTIEECEQFDTEAVFNGFLS